MVIGVNTYFLQVVVLPTDAKALLGIGHPRVLGILVTEEVFLELVHTGIGEHQGWIVLDHHGC